MTWFADTHYFIATLNAADAHHQRAVEIAQGPRPGLLTTQWILSELGDGLASRVTRQRFLAIVDALATSPDMEIVPADPVSFQQGLDLYRSRPDKDWSLTDCISFFVMKQRGLTEALTADHHFEQAGFVPLWK